MVKGFAPQSELLIDDERGALGSVSD